MRSAMSTGDATPTEPADPVVPLVRHEFTAIGARHAVTATDPTLGREPGLLAEEMLAELDRAASRFREDSEISAITRRAAAAPAGTTVTTGVSDLLADHLAAALRAAALTDGLVDCTVGRAVVASGYDADIDVVRARASGEEDPAQDPPRGDPAAPAVPGWRSLALDRAAGTLTLPAGCLLDLGSSAKARAADLVAARLAATFPGGFLVSLGGDVAVSGLLPPGGWRVGLADSRGRTRQVVVSSGQALATSSTRIRTWRSGGTTRHHIVDPRTGQVAEPVWAEVTCAGATALEANAASTAAVVLGAEAPTWLEAAGVPARLDPVAGRPVRTTGWPAVGVAA